MTSLHLSMELHARNDCPKARIHTAVYSAFKTGTQVQQRILINSSTEIGSYVVEHPPRSLLPPSPSPTNTHPRPLCNPPRIFLCTTVDVVVSAVSRPRGPAASARQRSSQLLRPASRTGSVLSPGVQGPFRGLLVGEWRKGTSRRNVFRAPELQ